jgi:hypothetical protein
MRSNRIMVATFLVVAAASSACSRTVVYKDGASGPVLVDEKHGPPSHAPAYGYRRNHAGDEDVVLVYDTTLEVYVVSGYDDCYYAGGQYYRFTANRWEWSVNVAGTWRIVKDVRDLPPGLRDKHGDGDGHGNGHAYGHSKH